LGRSTAKEARVDFLLRLPAVEPLAPIIDTLSRVRAQRGPAPVHGLVSGLVVAGGEVRPTAADDEFRRPSAGDDGGPTVAGSGFGLPAAGRDGWLPATAFTGGDRVADLLAAAVRRWNAAPHVAAALAFKSYAYWLALPAVVGYASARRVPLVAPENVLVRPHAGAPFVELGLVRPALAALADDPVTALRRDVTAVPDDPALLRYLRTHLLDGHLLPLIGQLHALARTGERTLLGSVASGIAYALVRSADALPGPIARTAAEILRALDLADLVTVDEQRNVQRHTCCLAFTLPQPKVCSGCCLPR
jgi:hypothetical protein